MMLKFIGYSNVILHSDQGWQYQMKKYHQRLKDKGIVQSMSRKGNCLDNSVIENFFGILKSEMFYKHKFSSTSELMKAIDEYIYYYNNNRIKLKLKTESCTIQNSVPNDSLILYKVSNKWGAVQNGYRVVFDVDGCYCL